MTTLVALLSSIGALMLPGLSEQFLALPIASEEPVVFESVEVGYTELSPRGEAGGQAIPASNESPPPPNCNINAEPETVEAGSAVNVCWAADGATYVYINKFGSVGVSGCRTHRPSSAGTEYYLMEAHNEACSLECGVKGDDGSCYYVCDTQKTTCGDAITVVPPTSPPNTSIWSTNNPSRSGESYTIRWSTDDGGRSETSCRVERQAPGSGSWQQVATSLSGSLSFSLTTDTDEVLSDRWRINCSNDKGSDSDQVAQSITPWPPQAEITQSTTEGEHGTAYNIEWRSKHANTCNIQVRVQHGNGGSWMNNWVTVFTESFAPRESRQGEPWTDPWRTETIDGSQTLSDVGIPQSFCDDNDLSCNSTLITPLNASDGEPSGYNLRAQWRASCTNAAGTTNPSVTHLIYPYALGNVTIDQNSNSTASDGTPLPNDESSSGDPFDIIWTSENAAECVIERHERDTLGGVTDGTDTYASGWSEIWHTDDAGIDYDDTEATVGTANGADNEQDWRITCTNERPSGPLSDSLEHYVWAPPSITFEICDNDGVSNCEDDEKQILVNDVDEDAPKAVWSTVSDLSTDTCQPVAGAGFETGGSINGTDPLPRPEPDTASEDNSETYTIGCTGNGGTATEDVILRTLPLPHLSTADYSVRIGEEIEVHWDTEGGDPDTCTLVGTNGDPGYNSTTTNPLPSETGDFETTIYETTSFDLECENGSHSITIFAIPVIHET